MLHHLGRKIQAPGAERTQCTQVAATQIDKVGADGFPTRTRISTRPVVSRPHNAIRSSIGASTVSASRVRANAPPPGGHTASETQVVALDRYPPGRSPAIRCSEP